VELQRGTARWHEGAGLSGICLEGQMHGGLVQGIGQALMENTVYDAEEQLIIGSYMDYAMPRAADVLGFVTAHHPVPAKTNPLGIKGCGEAGCAGALVAIPNAIIDALSDYGIRHIDMNAGLISTRPLRYSPV
jgi:carbon-monoxide dehydrogenase large subunit